MCDSDLLFYCFVYSRMFSTAVDHHHYCRAALSSSTQAKTILHSNAIFVIVMYFIRFFVHVHIVVVDWYGLLYVYQAPIFTYCIELHSFKCRFVVIPIKLFLYAFYGIFIHCCVCVCVGMYESILHSIVKYICKCMVRKSKDLKFRTKFNHHRQAWFFLLKWQTTRNVDRKWKLNWNDRCTRRRIYRLALRVRTYRRCSFIIANNHRWGAYTVAAAVVVVVMMCASLLLYCFSDMNAETK